MGSRSSNQAQRENRRAKGHPGPIRVAIVGGGCAGLAAAWQLSQQRGYKVDVFERSWRLGGKGASIRDSDGRILEHGLHVWLGFYENAFRMMRECYGEIEAQRKLGARAQMLGKLVHDCIDDAFFPEPHIGVARPDRHRDWTAWSGYFPPAMGLPGDALDEQTNPFTLANYLLRCFDLLKTLMLSVIGTPGEDVPGGPRPDERSTVDEAFELDFSVDATRSLRVLIERMTRLVRTGVLTTAAGLLQAVTILEVWLQQLNFAPQVADSALQLMEAVAAQTRKQLRDLVAIDEKLRAKTEVIDIVITIAVGLFRDRVLFDDRGLDALNHVDYRQWLLQHGATKTSDGRKSKDRNGKQKDASPVKFHFLHELDEVRFDFRSKDRRYVTSLKFKTRGKATTLDALGADALDEFGCWPGDRHRFRKALDEKEADTKEWSVGTDFDAVIFATGIDDFAKLLANVLPRDDDPDPDLPAKWARMCTEVKTVATQAAQVWLDRDLEGLGWYRGSGLITALDLSFDTWADMTHTLPTERDWRTAMNVNSDLDRARSVAYFCGVLSQSKVQDVASKVHDRIEDALTKLENDIRVLALAGVGQQTIGADKLRDHVQATIATLEHDVLGGRRLGDDARAQTEAVLSEVAQYVAAGHADLALAEDEARPLRGRVSATVARIERDAFDAGLDDEVDKGLTCLLTTEMQHAWPAAFGDHHNAANLELGRHVQANVEGSDRYTLSLPGSIGHRISPLERSVVNMTIAGDWTACGLDGGCVESAVMSGMLAAHAICGKPELTDIIGYDHP